MPYIIFPYDSSNADSLKNFSLFETYVEDDPIVTSSINCFKYSTACGKFGFIPGRLSISYPPHTEKRHLSHRTIYSQSYETLRNDVLSYNLHNYTTFSELKDEALKRPLFLLVSRCNAGDLEVKLPIIHQLVRLFSNDNIAFGFVTSPFIYEKFSIHPLTSFVSVNYLPPLSIKDDSDNFISDSFSHNTFRGDFTLESLAEFVFNNLQVAWGPRSVTNRLAITYVGSSVPADIVKGLENATTDYPLIFENTSVHKFISQAICMDDIECLAVVDYKTYRAISIPIYETTSINSNTMEMVAHFLSHFDELWKKLPFIKRVKSRFFIFQATNMVSFFVISFIFGLSLMLISSFARNRSVECTIGVEEKHKTQ